MQQLSPHDFDLLSVIVNEWFFYPTLSSIFNHWKSFARVYTPSISSELQILLFNVRGLAERWEEVLLLLDKYRVDVIILTEIGSIETSLVRQIFLNYKCFQQKGDNAWGGVMMLIKNSLPVSRVKCDLPNVVCVGVKLETTVRLCGVYAPKSKTWQWNALSKIVSNDCCLLGDFNVDLNLKKDERAAKGLLEWSESESLCPVVPSENTSLRSNRIIDYAFARGVSVNLQTCVENTTSDHRPIIGILKRESKENAFGNRTYWKVFNVFLALTAEFWEGQNKISTSEEYYQNFITLLDSLKTRCTKSFPTKKYRAAIPKELRMKLSLTRALACQHKRTGDVLLHEKIKEMRRQNRIELTEIRSKNLTNSMNERFSGSTNGNIFWSSIRKNFKTSEPLDAFIDDKNEVIKDNEEMLELAAAHFENIFNESEVYRPHPYVDSPAVIWDNNDEQITPITMLELKKVITKVKKKHSQDAQGISPHMLKYLPDNYLGPLLKIFNESLTLYTGPSHWKHCQNETSSKKRSNLSG